MSTEKVIGQVEPAGFKNRVNFITPDDILCVNVTTLEVTKDYTRKHYELYLYDAIYSSGIFELCDILHQATERDKVTIHLDTPGGSIMLMSHLLLAMELCKAPITTHAHLYACSCGAIIWSNGDVLKCDADTKIMFHDAAGGQFGKVEKMRAGIDALREWVYNLTRHALDLKLITTDEWDSLTHDSRDIYLYGSELAKRVEQANNILGGR